MSEFSTSRIKTTDEKISPGSSPGESRSRSNVGIGKTAPHGTPAKLLPVDDGSYIYLDEFAYRLSLDNFTWRKLDRAEVVSLLKANHQFLLNFITHARAYFLIDE